MDFRERVLRLAMDAEASDHRELSRALYVVAATCDPDGKCNFGEAIAEVIYDDEPEDRLSGMEFWQLPGIASLYAVGIDRALRLPSRVASDLDLIDAGE